MIPRVSVAVWVALVALVGLDAGTGVVMLLLEQFARFFARFNSINLSLEPSADTEFREINLCDADAECLRHITRRPARKTWRSKI